MCYCPSNKLFFNLKLRFSKKIIGVKRKLSSFKIYLAFLVVTIVQYLKRKVGGCIIRYIKDKKYLTIGATMSKCLLIYIIKQDLLRGPPYYTYISGRKMKKVFV
jgi:hypothetical protein